MALEKLQVAPPPHLREKDTVPVSMRNVLIALIPVVIASLVAFTYNALFLMAVCLATAALSELLMRKIMKKKATLEDGSAMVTGLLVSLLLPPTISWVHAVIATLVAVAIVKELMGGLGRNIFNPALFGFAFVLIASGALAPWTGHLGFISGGFDGVSSATPLVYLKQGLAGTPHPSYAALFFGYHGGALSEVGCLWILLGGGYLIYKKVIKATIPVTMLLTVFILSAILGKDPLYAILSGGLFLGAFFMATDWVTSPMTFRGQIVFAVIIGISVVLIRTFGAPPEGVAYSILIGNAFVPLLDRVFVPRKFGAVAA